MVEEKVQGQEVGNQGYKRVAKKTLAMEMFYILIMLLVTDSQMGEIAQA